jgi:predicted metal-dependent phosphoesterase TrpH
MRANLHMHSRFSDGTLWPEDVARSVARSGLEVAALTDHDTLAGSERFIHACRNLGVLPVTGCEIDVVEEPIGYKSELLGYFPGKSARECPATSALLDRVLVQRKARIESFIAAARVYFSRPDLSLEDLAAGKFGTSASADMPGLSWNRVDFFNYLKARRLVPQWESYREFGARLFGPGKIPKFKVAKPDLAEAVRSVHADGGFAVVPHIGHVWGDDPVLMAEKPVELRTLLRHFREAGVDGVEMYWYSNVKKTQAINAIVRAEAEPMGFFLTFGSDCHGPGSGNHTMGAFSGEFAGFPGVPMIQEG